MTRLIGVLAIVAYVLLHRYGSKDQIVGMAMFGALVFLMALFLFLKGTYPHMGKDDPKTKRHVRIAVACLILSALLIPIWSVMTWRFPPDGFTMTTALAATATLPIAVMGSATPWIHRFVSGLIALNRIQREEIRKKKSSQPERGPYG